MKYMLLVYSPESSWTPEEWRQCVATSTNICHDLAANGQFHAASPLHPVASAATVRIRDGQRAVTDGPFTETKEQLGGYYIIDVDNLDEAISIAARLPAATRGTVEIRPLLTLEGLPPETPFAAHSSDSAPARQFMLLCYDDESAWAQAGTEQLHAAMKQAVALAHRLHQQRRYLSAAPLHPSTTATSVRIRSDRRQVTDGPFMETREVLGGFYLIRARDRQEALEVAAQHPGVHVGAVEVREVHHLPNLPATAGTPRQVETPN